MANKFLNLVRAADAKELGGFSAKAILFLIADQANAETGLAWPGDEKLARDAGCSTRTVKTATKKLRACGVIEEFRAPVSACGLARVFRIIVPVLEKMASNGAAALREESSPRGVSEIGEISSPLAGGEGRVGVGPRVKSATTPRAHDDAQHVKTAAAFGAGISPLPLTNPNLKPPQQPEGWRSSKEESLKWLKELVAMSLGDDPPKVYWDDELTLKAERIVNFLDTKLARRLWDIFGSNCIFPKIPDDDRDLEPFDAVVGEAQESKAEPPSEPAEPFPWAQMIDLVLELADLLWLSVGAGAERDVYRDDYGGTADFTTCGRWLFRDGYTIGEIKAAMAHVGITTTTTVVNPLSIMIKVVPTYLHRKRRTGHY